MKIGQVGDIGGVLERPDEPLKFLLVAGPGGDPHHRRNEGLFPLSSGLSGAVFPVAPRRQQAFGGREAVRKDQVPNMKFVRRLRPGAPGRHRDPVPVWSAVSSHVQRHCPIVPDAAGGPAQGLAAAGTRGVAGQIPSPQKAKSASIFVGSCPMKPALIRRQTAFSTRLPFDQTGCVVSPSRNQSVAKCMLAKCMLDRSMILGDQPGIRAAALSLAHDQS